jgi:hypothetical protein
MRSFYYWQDDDGDWHICYMRVQNCWYNTKEEIIAAHLTNLLNDSAIELQQREAQAYDDLILQEKRGNLKRALQNAELWNSMANPSGGFINTSPLATFMAAKSRADATSQLIDNGYDANSINALLPQAPPKPRRINCDRFGSSISCTEQ